LPWSLPSLIARRIIAATVMDIRNGHLKDVQAFEKKCRHLKREADI
jgi:hypothetical protein